MLSGIFKELYRGSGIYWFGKHGYGDETNPMFRTIGEMRAAIDASIAKQLAREEEEMTPADKYWNTLNADQRHQWRRKANAAQTELRVSEFAYAATFPNSPECEQMTDNKTSDVSSSEGGK